jgi:pimeloyl-ACP methyl ester carboxylesterase
LILPIESLGVEQVAIVGHSLGGAIAAKVALERPDLVRALVLEEPALIPPPTPGQNNDPPAVLPFVQLMLAGEIESGVKGFIDFVSGPGTYDRFSLPERQFLIDNYRTVTEGSGPPLISCDDISHLAVPVLYVKGEVSPFAENPSEECIPNRTVITIANASHGIHYEKPADFNPRALEFLER